jgi:hypothetical protein
VKPAAAFVALLAFVLAAAPAAGQTTNAPPGNSAIDEYVESVLGSTGNRPTAPGAQRASGLPAKARRALAGRGADGQAVERLVASSGGAPKASRTPATAKSPRGGQPALATQQADSRSPVVSASDTALTGSGRGGMGVILPILLVSTSLVVIGLALRRRRAA